MSDAPNPEQSTEINPMDLLDAVRRRFGARIAELEDQATMQVSSLELGMKAVMAERNTFRAQSEALQRENAQLKAEMQELKAMVASLTPQPEDTASAD